MIVVIRVRKSTFLVVLENFLRICMALDESNVQMVSRCWLSFLRKRGFSKLCTTRSSIAKVKILLFKN